MPLTSRGGCAHFYASYDVNLQQTLFGAMAYAAVFCRMTPGAISASSPPAPACRPLCLMVTSHHRI